MNVVRTVTPAETADEGRARPNGRGSNTDVTEFGLDAGAYLDCDESDHD